MHVIKADLARGVSPLHPHLAGVLGGGVRPPDQDLMHCIKPSCYRKISFAERTQTLVCISAHFVISAARWNADFSLCNRSYRLALP